MPIASSTESKTKNSKIDEHLCSFTWKNNSCAIDTLGTIFDFTLWNDIFAYIQNHSFVQTPTNINALNECILLQRKNEFGRAQTKMWQLAVEIKHKFSLAVPNKPGEFCCIDEIFQGIVDSVPLFESTIQNHLSCTGCTRTSLTTSKETLIRLSAQNMQNSSLKELIVNFNCPDPQTRCTQCLHRQVLAKHIEIWPEYLVIFYT